MMLVEILLIIYYNFCFINLKRKKVNFLSDANNFKNFNFSDFIFCCSFVVYFFVFDGSLIVKIMILIFFRTYFSVVLRHNFSYIYYKHFMFNIGFEPKFINYFLVECCFNHFTKNFFFHFLLIFLNFKIWFLFFFLQQYIDFFYFTQKGSFDEVMFNKFRGEDIILMSSGKLKLRIYRRFLLDDKLILSEEFDKYFDYSFIPSISHEEHDFFYKNPKIEYLAKIDCF